jgi:hypothetical protein
MIILLSAQAGSRPPPSWSVWGFRPAHQGDGNQRSVAGRSQVTWSSMSRVSSSLVVDSSAGVRRRSGRVTGVRSPPDPPPVPQAEPRPPPQGHRRPGPQLLSRPQQTAFVLRIGVGPTTATPSRDRSAPPRRPDRCLAQPGAAAIADPRRRRGPRPAGQPHLPDHASEGRHRRAVHDHLTHSTTPPSRTRLLL